MQTKGVLIAEGNTAEVFAWGDAHILKLYRPGYTAADAEDEAGRARIVHHASIKTPAAIDVVTVDGRPGAIFERVNGPTMFEVMMVDPQQRAALTHLLAELHVTLHQVMAPELPTRHSQLQFALEKVANATWLSAENLARIHSRLTVLPEGEALCHGDFHPMNILLTDDGPVIIDWVDARRGDPLSDVARTVVLMRHAVVPAEIDAALRASFEEMRKDVLDIYLARYHELSPLDHGKLAQWVTVLAAARLAEGLSEAENQNLIAVASAIASQA